MKKLLLLLVIIVLFSCEKEICWECVTIKTDPASTSLAIPKGFERILTEEICGRTKEEIRNYEEMYTYTHNLFGIWWNQTCICKLKP